VNSAKFGEPSARNGGGDPEPSFLLVTVYDRLSNSVQSMRIRKYTDEQLEDAVRTSHSMRAVLRKIGLTPAGGNYEVVKGCQHTTWLDQPIPLELHHKDGDRTNNTLPNIELLCPNCHALTDNYRGSKKKV